MATNTLAALKFTNAKKPAQLSPIQNRRQKLIGRIDEQLALVAAMAEGRTYASTKTKVVVDADSGEKRSVETAKRVKQWWWAATDNGKIALTIKYGSKNLEIVKGKNAIEVGSVSELVKTLEVVKTAAAAGELDDAIAAASAKLRSGFGK
jgi:predicted nicotinamide N-methyase